MHLLAWLDALGAADLPTASAATRRAALARLSRGALAAVPAALVAPAVAAGPSPRVTSVVTDAFNLILRVARAQRVLLENALAAGTPPAGAPRERFQLVLSYTTNLIERIENSIRLSGDALPPPRTYDFTGNAPSGGGPLDPASYDDLLVLAQVFADSISRTLLSSLGVLAGNTVFAELSGQLLGTASRLAALVRLTRQERVSAVRPWIVDAEASTLPAIFTTTTVPYAGEASTRIYSILDLATTGPTAVLPVDPDRTAADLTAAFDQPLPLAEATMTTSAETLPVAAVNQLLAPFEF
ncbi:MAG: hypothetical protein H7330_02505 [Hymenobacteraceae bacterium]|nr:hypothetical protein [Hymenobacteraceae bacterium]